MDMALKAIGENRVSGYLIMWGSPDQRDLQGEFFTPNTDLALDWFNERPVLYQHGFDATLKTSRIGTIDTLKVDNVGVWAEAQLELRNRYVAEVLKLIEDGTIGWSSGSMSHLVIIDPEGEIKRWPLIEGSLTPTPAEPRISVRPIKHLHANSSAFKAQVDEIDPQFLKVLSAKAGQEVEIEISVTPSDEPSNEIVQENTTMDIQQIVDAVLQQLMALRPDVQLSPEEMSALAQQVSAALQPPTDSAAQSMSVPEMTAKAVELIGKELNRRAESKQVAEAAIKSAVAELMHGAIKANIGTGTSKVPAYSGEERATVKQDSAPRIEVNGRFHGLSAADMSYLAMLGEHWKGIAPTVKSADFRREMAGKVEDGYKAGKLRLGDRAETDAAVKSLQAIKANELDHSTQSGYGDEWVPTLWASQIWDQARLDNVIMPLFDAVEMPSNPFELPVESTDPTVYYVPETTDESQLLLSGAGASIPDSRFATSKVTLTARKLALRVGISAELDEDSIIAIAPQARRQAERAIEDSIDNVLLNGDIRTGANTNINLIDGTPAATARYLVFNGIRETWLNAGGASQRIDGAGGALSLTQIRSARFALNRAYSANPKNLAVIVHSEAYNRMLGLQEFITMDKAGNLATAITGQIGAVDGMPVVVSNEYALTNNVGAIPNAGGTLASLSVVYRPGFKIGFRRRVMTDMSFLPYYDAYQLTVTVRLAFVRRGTDVAAGVYNLAA